MAVHPNRGFDPPASRALSVLALVTDAYGGYGGIAQYNRDLLGAISRYPSPIDIQVLPRLAPAAVEEIPRFVTQLSPISNRIRYAAAAAFLARRRPTIVFSGHLYHGPLAHRIARLTRSKLISQVHGTEIWGDLRPRHRRPLEASDLILTVSRDTRARLLSKADIAPEKVVVLNNTVGSDYMPGDRASARARFGLTDEFVVLTVARLDAREGYKGHDRIIPLIPLVQRPERKVIYLIAGVGDDQPRLRRMAQKYGIEENVRFLGKVPRPDLPDLYRAADLFALPSTGEGFGISFLEAMACGTPTIGLAVGGAPDALGDGDLGLCVPEGDFPTSFIKLVETPQSTRHVAAVVDSRFSFESFTTHCHRVFALAL